MRRVRHENWGLRHGVLELEARKFQCRSCGHYISAPDGTFSIQQLAAGTYRVCVQLPSTTFLDPCQWSASAPTVTLSDGQAFTGLHIVLQVGTMLKVHVNDPSGLLDAHEGKTPGAHLLVGVWASTGLFCPAYIATKGNGQREYRLVIPNGTPLKLSVQSRFFRLSD